MLHEQLATFYRGFRRDAHPMAIMCGVVGALSAFYHDSTDITDPKQRMIASHRLIAKMPTIAAMAYKYSIGQPFMYPQNSLTYTGNFLRMTFGVPAEPYEVNPVIENAMRRIFILHADHEQNASTSTVRLAGSSGANPFACIAAGIACLWGPAHGGANEAALNMLREIGRPERIPEYIARAKDKDDPFRLMGFGHRVYKNFDPRAKVMQKTAEEVLNELGISDPVLDTAQELAEIALKDDYFIEKKLYPNVDFYSGVILSAIGFPTDMFTALFALARTVGWVAQWNEMISDPDQKIGRPRQLYCGADPARLRAGRPEVGAPWRTNAPPTIRSGRRAARTGLGICDRRGRGAPSSQGLAWWLLDRAALSVIGLFGSAIIAWIAALLRHAPPGRSWPARPTVGDIALCLLAAALLLLAAWAIAALVAHRSRRRCSRPSCCTVAFGAR